MRLTIPRGALAAGTQITMTAVKKLGRPGFERPRQAPVPALASHTPAAPVARLENSFGELMAGRPDLSSREAGSPPRE